MQFVPRLIALIVACALGAGVLAQVRSIPQDAKRGEMRHLQDLFVEIDGVAQRLAPGAQIRDASNRVVVPTALPSGSKVKYVVNAQGQVRRVWILTPEEAAKR